MGRRAARGARASSAPLKEEGRALLRELRETAEERARFERFVAEQEAAIAAQASRQPPRAPEEAAATPAPPQIGDIVEVGDRGIRGELLAVDGARAWIQRGAMRFEVPAAQLRRIARPAPSAAPRRINAASEVDVRAASSA